jgi:hypothetical protein
VDEQTVRQLFVVASLPDKKQQRAAFAELVGQAPKPGRLVQSATASRTHARATQSEREPKRVRCVAYFNPEIFARQRWLAQSTLDEVRAHVHELNQRLANPRSRLKPGGAVRLLEERLRHHDLVTSFEVKTQTKRSG